ncbi:MAG: lamin tail domain-containing protein [Nocardioidaceae bacterium]
MFRRTRALPATLALGLAAAGLTLPLTSASAVSPDVVISEVYGGGGNSGATLRNDFIELRNLAASAVDLTGWSVQYASAAGTTWQVTPLSGSISPGGLYLVKEAAGAGGTTDLPAADASGSIAMSATAAKVALVTTSTALSCGATCSSAPNVRDFVGWGTANDFEGAPAPGTSNTTSDSRGDADTDNNGADFTAGAPSPQGSGRPPEVARIHDIQGAAHRSPRVGTSVSDVPGIVTELTTNGFWMQDATPDANPATSEGIFVFTSSAPAVHVGDAVTVSASVQEFRPGSSSNANLATTELSGATVTVVSTSNPLPAATLVGPDGRVPPGAVVDDDANGSVETSGTFDANTDGIDFWESMEGMRVQLDDAQVVGPTNQFNETAVVPAGSGVRTDRGGILLQADDTNPERVLLDTFGSLRMPSAIVGDSVDGSVIGVLDYNFGNFHLMLSTLPTYADGGTERETTDRAAQRELSIASFNVENLDPTDPQAQFDAMGAAIVDNLAAPDLLTLEEIQDNNGATNDGTVAADQTLDKLVAAIQAAGGPAYQWRQISPENNSDGGEPGGNIRVAFLFRTDRGLSFVDRPGGDATTPTDVVVQGGRARLSVSPGRIDPANDAWDNSRKPLVGEFKYRSQTVFVIANHFASKSGDDPLFGRFQPPVRDSEEQRHAQAEAVRGFVDELLAVNPSADVVVAGDLNDFEFSETTDILVGSGDTALVDLPRTLPKGDRYSYVFEGNSQVLDHILLSPAAAAVDHEYDTVHMNAEFPDQISDHDPQVVRLAITNRGAQETAVQAVMASSHDGKCDALLWKL